MREREILIEDYKERAEAAKISGIGGAEEKH